MVQKSLDRRRDRYALLTRATGKDRLHLVEKLLFTDLLALVFEAAIGKLFYTMKQLSDTARGKDEI